MQAPLKTIALGLPAAVAVLAGVMLLRGQGEAGVAGKGRAASQVPSAVAASSQTSEAVLSIAPGARREAVAATVSATNVSPAIRDLANWRGYKALYDRIRGSSAPTAEDLYTLAEILERCAKVSDRKSQPARMKLGGDEARASFIAALAPKAPDRERRIAAFDLINHDGCAGLEGLETTESEIRTLLQKASAQGDMKARALVLSRDLERARRGPNGEVDRAKPAPISDAQIEEFRRIAASGDPRALVDVVRIFSSNLENLHLRAPDGSLIRPDNLYSAATLVACELGYPCGVDSRYLATACALEGYCDAADYRDFLFYYGSTPGDSQRIAEYQAQLTRAIRGNDWSYFDFHRGPTPSMAPFHRQ